ncbi:hypothetical protein ACJJTC_000845 [Scirpophaga incertulas]
MKLLIAFVGLLALALASTPAPTGKVVCYYDSKSYTRESQAHMLPTDLDPALSFCTHLVYGYAGIQPDTYKMIPLNENLDVDRLHANYRTITNFKTKYPGMKVLLSVGGDADTDDQKYNLLLESPQARTAFVNSGVLLADQHGFDGIDLAWQFARIKPKKIRSTWGSIWHGIKKTFGTTLVDDKEAEHREGYTALVREMKQALSVKPNMQLSITVLPNVNSSVARTWKLDSDSEISGVPPIHTDGPGEAGPYTKTEGLLSYPEVCAKLINPNHQKGMRPHLRKVTDPSKRFGTYAFRLPDDNGEGGLWVSYEDPETAAQKASYVKSKNLGGISIVDLSMDDFRGLCTGDKYPILRAAKYRL